MLPRPPLSARLLTMTLSGRLPIIDIAPLLGTTDESARQRVAEEIHGACRETGFFYVSGHGIPETLLGELEAASRAFFALPLERKMSISMSKGGSAWRGYFPVGGELTSGKPDLKEGLYFGSELPAEDPRVEAGIPLHGANLWPDEPAGLRPLVEAYMDRATACGHAVAEGIALALGLDAQYFRRHYTADPTILFRIFHYPAPEESEANAWGVGEHSDYGFLTMLAQDASGGLQVKTPAGWIDAPPLPGTLVCNIGDMLDRLTGGWFRSTPHRVRNASGRGRLSFPLFFDPDFGAEIQPLPRRAVELSSREAEQRWDGADLRAWEGTYGDYLLAKVSKVFPELGGRVLGDG